MTAAPHVVPVLDGVLDARQAQATAEQIAAVQTPDGAIAWHPGGHLDPWDHVQSAMGLGVAGWFDEARQALRWCRETQRPDGTWAAKYVDGAVVDASTDANFTAYVATGVWHHWRLTSDRSVVADLWPTVERALDAVVDLQRGDGTIAWSRDTDGTPADEALLTGSASMHLSLRCGLALADVVGVAAPHWHRAARALRHALDHHGELFAPRDRYSMDWYYPVLGGAMNAAAARRRLDARWDEFVVDGLGARCVADRPWVTGGETAELVLALDVVGRADAARRLLADVQHLRLDDGRYWTGYVYPDDAFWPIEQTTWTAATMLLAVDALTRTTPANGLFRGDDLPTAAARGGADTECACSSVA